VNLLGKKNAYLNEAHNRYIRPIVFHRWKYPGQNFDRHTYPKGASVIHMMRWILGEKPFLKAISHFLHKHAFQPVDTHDFLTAIKEASGQNMDWFFQQWLLSPGHPVFNVAATWSPTEKRVLVNVSQVQDRSKGIPIFKTPMVFKIVTPAGKRLHRVWIKKLEEEFEFPCTMKPLLVRFDEGNYLLKEWTYKKSADELLYQLKKDDVIGRSWAAGELSKLNQNSKVMKALKTSAAGDTFWYVRRAAVLSLGKFPLKKLIPFLKKRALDTHSRVRRAALILLGQSERKNLVPFFQERFKKETSYLAQAEALRAIGRCGDQSNLEFLKKAAKIDSPRNVLSRAANWAIKAINKK
jgi:aminopeptidase N